MFDTIVHRQEPRFPQQINKTVTEIRAPTDKSVELLREMEAKARHQVVATLKVDDNSLNYGVVLHHNPAEKPFEDTVKVKYKLNGHEFYLEFDVQHKEYRQVEQLRELAERVQEEVGKHIAQQIALQAVKSRMGALV